MILGPTFAEMRDPSLLSDSLRAEVAQADPLDPKRLYAIRWVQDDGAVDAWLVPPALSGVKAPIAVMLGYRFPTGSHKVGPAYSCLVERQLRGDIQSGAVSYTHLTLPSICSV